MSKILIVSDVHGRKFWHKAKEMINNVDKVVFLGDYLDPYSYEGVSRLDAIKEFREIIKFKEDNPDKVILLLGNHDCAYCFDFGSASRYDYSNESIIKKLFGEEPIITNKWACLDVRRCFLLDTNTGKIEEVC